MQHVRKILWQNLGMVIIRCRIILYIMIRLFKFIGHYMFFRQKLSLNISDDSGAIDVTVFRDYAAKFLLIP